MYPAYEADQAKGSGPFQSGEHPSFPRCRGLCILPQPPGIFKDEFFERGALQLYRLVAFGGFLHANDCADRPGQLGRQRGQLRWYGVQSTELH
jgi:hypothetical protein